MNKQIHTRLNYLLLLVLVVFSFSSCLDDRYDSSKDYSLAGGSLRLTALVPASGQATRSLTSVEETYIQSIDILVFVDDRAGNETFAYYVEGEDIDNDSHATERTFTARLRNSNGEFHRLYVFANLQEDILRVLPDLYVGMDKEEVLDRLTFYTATPWNTTTSYRKLPMAGVSSYSLAITPSTRPLQIGTIPLLRAVVRIDVGLNMDQSYIPQGFSDDLFYLTDTYIYNGMDSARAIPYETSYESIDKKKVDQPSIPAYANRMGESSPIQYTHTTEGSGIMGEIYIAESDNNASGITFEEITCLVIGGYYKNSTQKSWYRIDFFDKTAADTLNTWQDILRNHRYTVNISSVDGKGYPDPGIAFKSKQVDIQTQILRWEEGYDSDVIYDEKQNYLRVNKGKWEFQMEAVDVTASNDKLTIETSWPGGWQITGFTDKDGAPIHWLSASVTNGGTGVITETSLLLDVNDSGKPRTGYIHVTAGNLTYLVEVYQHCVSIKYDCLYPLNGEIHSLSIKSANSWTVTLTDNGTVIKELLTTSGTGNLSGEKIEFRTERNDMPYEGVGVLTISSPDFDDIRIPIRCGTGEIVNNSNSYIVKPGAMGIRIPVSRANEHTTRMGEADAISVTDVITAELIWTDHPKGISCESNLASVAVMGSGAGGYVQVWPGEAEGNALVAVKVNGVIKWSWHIWVTHYNPDAQGATFSHYNDYSLMQTTTVFMDRNLGAISNTPGDPATMGLLYQWGRKDPFPGGKDFTGNEDKPSYNAQGELIPVPSSYPTTKEGDGNLAMTITAPTQFLGGSSANYYDWYSLTSGIRDHTLWGARAGKTIYDPCPIGWRIADSGLMERSVYYTSAIGLSYNPDKYKGTWNNGWNFLDDIFRIGYYPAAGYRSNKINKIGVDGAYWSAQFNGMFPIILELHEDDIDIAWNAYTVYGFSVRCVKE